MRDGREVPAGSRRSAEGGPIGPKRGQSRASDGLRLLAALACLCAAASAQAPPGYYAGVDDSDPAALRLTLHQAVDDHLRFPYTSGGIDTWNILELAEEDPADAGRILDVYRNASYPKAGGGNPNYDREHSWPNSYGFPDDGGTNYPFTDCHMLFLCDGSYNSSRSNKPFRYCDTGCQEKVTLPNNGQGGGSGVYPGQSNWTEGSLTAGTWETWIGRRGDVARALMYADVRYEGGTHGGTGAAEPDLVLTDSQALIAASNTGSNEPLAYMGMLSALLQWHYEDPVDDFERRRNDVVFGFQGNRNPFVDHPEWVDCLFAAACGTGTVYCSGDGTGTACPCANAGDPGHGCANGSFPGGCALVGTGQPSLGADTLVLSVSDSTPSQPGLFFQGDNAPGNGAGATFGDGLRCAGGGLVRLQVRVANASGAASSTLSIAAAAGPAPGELKRYQWWYRDPALSLCGAGFNLSNGLEVIWSP